MFVILNETGCMAKKYLDLELGMFDNMGLLLTCVSVSLASVLIMI